LSTNDPDSGGDGGGSLTINLPANLIRRIQAGAIAGLLPGVTGAMILKDKVNVVAEFQKFIIEVVNDWLIASFVEPIVGAVLGLGELIIETIFLVAFGFDRTPGGAPGILDAVVWVAESFVGATAGPTSEIVGVITSFNAAIASTAAGAGLAAPIVVGLLWGLEIAVVVFTLITILRTLNLPLIDVDDLLDQLLSPIKFLARKLQ
jgi:hypothetical protein